MNGEVYEIGELVRFREWEDMEREFGLDGCGDISCPATFTTEMRNLCGVAFCVQDRDSYDGDYTRYHGHNTRWSVSGAMLERANTNPVLQIKSEIDIL